MSDTLKVRILGDPSKTFSRGFCKPQPGSSFAALFAKPAKQTGLGQKILNPIAGLGEKFKQEGPLLRQIEAVAATTPAAQQARFDRMTLRQIKRDPLFRMYERSLNTRACERPRRTGLQSPRPRARRTSSSSRTSGVDPGDSDLPPAEEVSPADLLAALVALPDDCWDRWWRELREDVERDRAAAGVFA